MSDSETEGSADAGGITRLVVGVWLSEDAAGAAGEVQDMVASVGRRARRKQRRDLYLDLVHLADFLSVPPQRLIDTVLDVLEGSTARPFEALFDRLASTPGPGHATPFKLFASDPGLLLDLRRIVARDCARAGVLSSKTLDPPSILLGWLDHRLAETPVKPVSLTVDALSLIHILDDGKQRDLGRLPLRLVRPPA